MNVFPETVISDGNCNKCVLPVTVSFLSLSVWVVSDWSLYPPPHSLPGLRSFHEATLFALQLFFPLANATTFITRAPNSFFYSNCFSTFKMLPSPAAPTLPFCTPSTLSPPLQLLLQLENAPFMKHPHHCFHCNCFCTLRISLSQDEPSTR